MPASGATVPMAHGTHADVSLPPKSGLAVPGGHAVQLPIPVTSTKVPGGQGEHSPVPSFSANVPVGHGSHWLGSVALRRFKNVPAGHKSHAGEAYAWLYVPGKHAVQFPVPATSLNDPGGHASHPVALNDPKTSLNRPAGHPSHFVAPVLLSLIHI